MDCSLVGEKKKSEHIVYYKKQGHDIQHRQEGFSSWKSYGIVFLSRHQFSFNLQYVILFMLQ